MRRLPCGSSSFVTRFNKANSILGRPVFNTVWPSALPQLENHCGSLENRRPKDKRDGQTNTRTQDLLIVTGDKSTGHWSQVACPKFLGVLKFGFTSYVMKITGCKVHVADHELRISGTRLRTGTRINPPGQWTTPRTDAWGSQATQALEHPVLGRHQDPGHQAIQPLGIVHCKRFDVHINQSGSDLKMLQMCCFQMNRSRTPNCNNSDNR